MTYNLRKLIESDMQYTLEGDYSMPVILKDPSGVTYELRGQVLYDTAEFDPETGAMLIYEKPVVTLRRSSLSRLPKANERWAVTIPPTPQSEEATQTYLADLMNRPPEGGRSIGFIRLYLIETEQSS